MRGLFTFVGVLVLVIGLGAVVRYEKKPAAQEQAAVQPLPDRTYNAQAFDTVVWANQEAAIARGKDVFAWVCAKCHGPAGKGDGGYIVEGDTLHPPSFVQPGWRFADAPNDLWKRIYLGNNRGMPHWGDQGLQPRDVIAVATYIQKDLRKDVK